MAMKDLTGMRFGKLTVIRMEKVCRAKTGARWFCRCDCGAEILVKGTHLTHGQRKTCGNYGAHKASTVCKYQDAVRCTGGDCRQCGWNPEVARARITKWRIAWEKMNS